MKKLKLSILILCISCSISNIYAQDSTSTKVPIDLNEFRKSAASKSLTGIVNLKSNIADVSTIEENLKVTNGCQEPIPPKDLAGLTGGWNIFFYSLTLDAAANLGIISLGEVSANYGKEVFVYEQMYYKDAKNCKGENITFGAGVRLTILAKKLSASANFSNLGAIAASAEFKSAEVEVRIKTVGLSGPEINSLPPSAGSYSIEKHVQYLQAIDAIKNAISKTTTKVTPEVISIQLTPIADVEYAKANYTAFALRRIAKGESFTIALTKLKEYDRLGEETIKAVYLYLVKTADLTKPSQITILTAKNLIKNTE